jgi:hypothetical protein
MLYASRSSSSSCNLLFFPFRFSFSIFFCFFTKRLQV